MTLKKIKPKRTRRFAGLLQWMGGSRHHDVDTFAIKYENGLQYYLWLFLYQVYHDEIAFEFKYMGNRIIQFAS